MNAFILGAGLGTRLRPLTDYLPKPLVPVFHEPLVHYALRHCLDAGASRFAINTHHLPEAWGRAFPDAEFSGCSIEFFYEPTLLETGGGIRNIAPFIGDETLLIYNGDIFTDIDVPRLVNEHRASGNIATLALRSTGENCNVCISGDKVSDMRGILTSGEGTHQFTGIYCIEPAILPLIPPGEVVSIVPAFIELIRAGKLGACVLDDGDWFDIGNPQAYHEIHRHLSAGRNDAVHPDAVIHPDAILSGSVVGPGAKVSAGASLKNCIVWPGADVAADTQATGEIFCSSVC